MAYRYRNTMTKDDISYNKRQQGNVIFYYKRQLSWSNDELYDWLEENGYKRYLYANSIKKLGEIRDCLLDLTLIQNLNK